MQTQTPKQRFCMTRKLKTIRAFRRSANLPPALFNGSLHFIQCSFGGHSVSDKDLAVALQYATVSADAIKQYCQQYGSVRQVNVDPAIYSLQTTKVSYNDQDVQSWTETLAQQRNFPPGDALVFLNPVGPVNTDSPLSRGYIGYHNATGSHRPYIFLNLEGAGITLDDAQDLFAIGLSHEIAEMVVDPMADLSNPEVCDPCGGNCGIDTRNYFNAGGSYISSGPPAPPGYNFFTAGIVAPYAASACPAPIPACSYAPTTPPAPPIPSPGPGSCIETIKQGVAELEKGSYVAGISDVLRGIYCLLEAGHVSETSDVKLSQLRLQMRHRPKQ